MTTRRRRDVLVVAGALVCLGIIGMAYARSRRNEAQQTTSLLVGQSTSVVSENSSGAWPPGWATYTPRTSSRSYPGVNVPADLTPPATSSPNPAWATREAASAWLERPGSELGPTFVADLLPLLASDDPETRWLATSRIHSVTLESWEVPETEARVAELRASKAIREALLVNAEYDAFVSVNPYSEERQITSDEVRAAAMGAIAVLYEGDPALEALAERVYEKETDEEALNALIDMIRVHGYTSPSMEAILEALSTNISPAIAANAAYALAELRGRRALEDRRVADSTPEVHRALAEEMQEGRPSQGSPSLKIVGHIDPVSRAGSTCLDMAIVGDVLYALCAHRLITSDITVPARPTLLDSLEGDYEQISMAVAEPHVFIFDAMAHLRVVDIANPDDLKLMSDVGLTTGVVREMATDGAILYLAEAPGAKALPTGLRVLDVVDPARPGELDLYALPDFDAVGLEVRDGHIYVAVGNVGEGYGQLLIFDASEPSELDLVSAHIANGAVKDVALSDSHAYINVVQLVDDVSELQAVDVTVLSEPYGAGTFEYPGAANAVAVPGYRARVNHAFLDSLAISGTHVFSAESYFGLAPGHSEPEFTDRLRWLDVADPSAPLSVASMGLPLTSAQDVVVSGSYVFVAGEEGIVVVRASK